MRIDWSSLALAATIPIAAMGGLNVILPGKREALVVLFLSFTIAALVYIQGHLRVRAAEEQTLGTNVKIGELRDLIQHKTIQQLDAIRTAVVGAIHIQTGDMNRQANAAEKHLQSIVHALTDLHKALDDAKSRADAVASEIREELTQVVASLKDLRIRVDDFQNAHTNHHNALRLKLQQSEKSAQDGVSALLKAMETSRGTIVEMVSWSAEIRNSLAENHMALVTGFQESQKSVQDGLAELSELIDASSATLHKDLVDHNTATARAGQEFRGAAERWADDFLRDFKKEALALIAAQRESSRALVQSQEDEIRKVGQSLSSLVRETVRDAAKSALEAVSNTIDRSHKSTVERVDKAVQTLQDLPKGLEAAFIEARKQLDDHVVVYADLVEEHRRELGRMTKEEEQLWSRIVKRLDGGHGS